MKKIIVTLLSLSVVLSMVGCGSDSPTSATSPTSASQITSASDQQSGAEDTKETTEATSENTTESTTKETSEENTDASKELPSDIDPESKTDPSDADSSKDDDFPGMEDESGERTAPSGLGPKNPPPTDPAGGTQATSPSGEFQATTNLVKVQPYKDSVKTDDGEEHTRYGLADGEGKRLCDPIYDNCQELPNGYALTKDKKYAFVSMDGSVYSGLVYDMQYQYYYYSPDNHSARFITKTNTGVTVADYDEKTGQLAKTFDLKVSSPNWAESNLEDRSDGEEEYEETLFFIEGDRYLGHSAVGMAHLWDGTTGQAVTGEDGANVFGCVGSLLYTRPSYLEGAESLTVYDYSGHILYKGETRDTMIHSFKENELYLITSGNQLMVMDATGKITAKTDIDEDASSIGFVASAGYLILYKDGYQVVYDSALKELGRLNLGENSYLNTLSHVTPCFSYNSGDNKVTIMNLETNKKTEFIDANDIHEDPTTGNIIVYSKNGRQILNAKDLSDLTPKPAQKPSDKKS